MIAWMQPATRGTSFKTSWPSTTRSLTAALIFQPFRHKTRGGLMHVAVPELHEVLTAHAVVLLR